MAALVLPVDAAQPEPAVIARAARIIAAGGLVAVPTETVYGLAANATDPRAVQRIFDAKGRPSLNPLIVHLADANDLASVARNIPSLARTLAERFWPGPLTLVMQKQPVIADGVSAGLDTVGVRVPAHAVTRALIRAVGLPLAAPSANRFTRISPTTAAHVVAQLGDLIDLILDAGPAPVGIESTVLDLTTSPLRLLRPGGVSRDAIEAVTGPLGDAPSLETDDAHPSPGLAARHYAPATTLRLFRRASRAAVIAEAARMFAEGRRVAVVVPDDIAMTLPFVRRMPANAAFYARDLYGMLHELEDESCDLAFVEEPPNEVEWDAIRDRLRRAATAPE
ncbi:MAG: L-threonylcarbamoyladenylate synthase [Gemmatimonadaceae bacterium]